MRTQILPVAIMFVLAGAASAQTSTLYLSGNGTMSAQQGGTLQDQWDVYNHDVGYSNDTFGVAHTIKCVGRIPSQYGEEFDLSGNPTGNIYYGPLQDDWTTFDGACDGSRNYATGFFSGSVFQFDADWQNPLPLFSVSPTVRHGLTWDGSNNSLWISTYGENTISNYAMDGTLLSSFSGDSIYSVALALDPADGTLWAADYGNTPVFRQYDRSGTLLDKFDVNGIDGSMSAAAEFAVLGAPPCYADCDGSTGLDLFDFLCFTNAFNAQDGYADCTSDGVLDLFDFLCFVNEFNGGC